MEQVVDRLGTGINKLILNSERNGFDPFNRVQYPPQLDKERLQFPEEFLSIYFHPVYSRLSDEQKWKLSLLETVNFFSLNIQGEQSLIRGLSERLYRSRFTWDSAIASQYMQHFIHEENAHTYMLAGYCTKYYGQLMPEPIIVGSEQPRLSPICEDLLFYARTALLECFLGFLNRIAKADDRIDETARTIHTFHYLDESRHVAFDRLIFDEIIKVAKGNGLDNEIQLVAKLLQEYQDYIEKRLYNFRIYREIGLSEAFEIYREAQILKERQNLTGKWLSQGSNLIRKLNDGKSEISKN